MERSAPSADISLKSKKKFRKLITTGMKGKLQQEQLVQKKVKEPLLVRCAILPEQKKLQQQVTQKSLIKQSKQPARQRGRQKENTALYVMKL